MDKFNRIGLLFSLLILGGCSSINCETAEPPTLEVVVGSGIQFSEVVDVPGIEPAFMRKNYEYKISESGDKYTLTLKAKNVDYIEWENERIKVKNGEVKIDVKTKVKRATVLIFAGNKCYPINLGKGETGAGTPLKGLYLTIKRSLNESELVNAEEAKIEKEEKKVEATKTVESLSSKFIIKNDDFVGLTYYTHKTFGSYRPARKTIYAEVANNGGLYVYSNYYADDWLFHTMVTLKAGDESITSSTVETYDNNHRTDIQGGTIYENVRYQKDGVQLAEFIVKNIDKEIKVRFHGSKFIDDTTLSEKDKQAILDSYELYKAFNSM